MTDSATDPEVWRRAIKAGGATGAVRIILLTIIRRWGKNYYGNSLSRVHDILGALALKLGHLPDRDDEGLHRHLLDVVSTTRGELDALKLTGKKARELRRDLSDVINLLVLQLIETEQPVSAEERAAAEAWQRARFN
jgi:hypothetical protein